MILNMCGGSGGSGESMLITDTTDANGGIIRTITGKVVQLQTKTITPTSSQQIVNPDTGYDGFSQVTVEAGGSVTQDANGYIVLPKTGGGGSWQTVFEGSVTTTLEHSTSIQGLDYNELSNSIKVTFNGVEYSCEKNADDSFGATYDESTQTYDWSEYPFAIYPNSNGASGYIDAETAGTHTLKIEAPQSGGSSDFSTVTATLNATFPEDYYIFHVSCSLGQSYLIDSVILAGEYYWTDYEFDAELTPSALTFLKFGESGAFRIFADDVIVSGNATFDSETHTVTFTGDFTITFSAIEP